MRQRRSSSVTRTSDTDSPRSRVDPLHSQQYSYDIVEKNTNELLGKNGYNQVRNEADMNEYKQQSQPYLTIGIPTRTLYIISCVVLSMFIPAMLVLIFTTHLYGYRDTDPLPWKPVAVFTALYLLMGLFNGVTRSQRTHKMLIGLTTIFIITALCYLSVSRRWLNVLTSSWNRKWYPIYYLQWLTTTPIVLLMFGSLTNASSIAAQQRIIDTLNNKPVDITIQSRQSDIQYERQLKQHNINIFSMTRAITYNTVFIIFAILSHCLDRPYNRIFAALSIILLTLTVIRIDWYLKNTPMILKQKHIDMFSAVESEHEALLDKFTPKLQEAHKANMAVLLFLRVWIDSAYAVMPLIWMLGITNCISEYHEHCAYFITDVVLKIGISSGIMCLNNSSVDELITLKQALLKQQLVQSASHSQDTANENRASFLRYLFHEIRGPLNAVVLGLRDIQSSSLTAEYIETYNLMIDGVNKCTRLLDDANSLNTYDVGQMHSEESDFSVAVLIQQILHLMKPAIDANRLKVSVVVAADVPQAIIADKGKITQIFANILSNAIQFSPKHDTISVKVSTTRQSPVAVTAKHSNAMQRRLTDLMNATRSRSADTQSPTRVNTMLQSLGLRSSRARSTSLVEDGSSIASASSGSASASDTDTSEQIVNLHISVTDNGCGISDADQKKLFIPYQQIGLALKTKSQTTGLGLSICARVINHLHGSKGVISRTGVDSFTTVWFCIPVRVGEIDDDDNDTDDNESGTPINVSPKQVETHNNSPATRLFHLLMSPKSHTQNSSLQHNQPSIQKQSQQLRRRRPRSRDTGGQSHETQSSTVQPITTDKLEVLDINRPRSPILSPVPVEPHTNDRVVTPTHIDDRHRSAPPTMESPTTTLYDIDTDSNTSRQTSTSSNQSNNTSVVSIQPMPTHNTEQQCTYNGKLINGTLLSPINKPVMHYKKNMLPVVQTDFKITCLIVDDVPSNRKLLTKVLSKTYGFQCFEADDGDVAVEKVKENLDTYDCILMDENMPRMRGSDAVKLIRAMGYTQPIVGITGNALQNDIDHFIVCGATQILPKPVNIRKLIRTLINSSPRLKQVLRQYAITTASSTQSSVNSSESGTPTIALKYL